MNKLLLFIVVCQKKKKKPLGWTSSAFGIVFSSLPLKQMKSQCSAASICPFQEHKSSMFSLSLFFFLIIVIWLIGKYQIIILKHRRKGGEILYQVRDSYSKAPSHRTILVQIHKASAGTYTRHRNTDRTLLSFTNFLQTTLSFLTGPIKCHIDNSWPLV